MSAPVELLVFDGTTGEYLVTRGYQVLGRLIPEQVAGGRRAARLVVASPLTERWVPRDVFESGLSAVEDWVRKVVADVAS